MKTYQMLVDGAWVGAESGRTFAVMNPATGEVMAARARGARPPTWARRCARPAAPSTKAGGT